jgi:hypothetical protein
MSRTIIPVALLLVHLAAAAYAGTNRLNTAPGLGEYDLPFYPNGTYRAGVQPPDEFLGYTLGAKPTSYDNIIAYFEYLAETFPNATLHDYGETYEGRRLVYLVVTSEANTTRLADIRRDIAKLADPRKLDNDGEATRIVETTPAVAWTAYGIHGDELSSCDAALQLAYQLLAGTDAETRLVVDELVVCIDPCENPDGRTRWLQMMAQWNGVVPSHDVQSLAHRGMWPRGRMNHYLFDLNRDWFATVHPETQGKTEAILKWTPQYLLDAHEMGSTDTYMFSPPREPFNPYMVDYIHKWWRRAAVDLGRAFDPYGWSYYTREWNEEFFPGYGSSWAIYLGAVGMLFEQARVDGSQVKRPEGTVMTYRESVHHQFLGSFANLLTCANGREELLADYYNIKLKNVKGKDAAGAFLFPPSANESRLALLAEKIQHQQIEVETATGSFKVGQARSGAGSDVKNMTFPEGTLIVRTNQPLKQLVEVLLSFDIRIPTSFLEVEKKEILKRSRSKLYETTAWSMPLAFGVDAYYAESLPRVKTQPYTASEAMGKLTGADSPIGFVFDCTDDRSYHLLSRLLERDHKVWSSTKPFENKGRLFPRGSFQIRLNSNPNLDTEELAELAEETGVNVYGIETSLGHEYTDLGGKEFKLLEKPRIALFGGHPASAYTFGACWHLLDNRFGMRTTLLDVARLNSTDLDKYNVLVLPNVWRDAMTYKSLFGKGGIAKLNDWIESGGTLIAIGNASAFLADSSVAVSKVRPRRQVLKKLARYETAIKTAEEAEAPVVDSLAVWEGAEPKGDDDSEMDEKTRMKYDQIKAADEKARKLYPRGAILSVVLDEEHWLTVGCGKTLPVMFNTNYAYMTAGNSVQVPGRLADGKDIRLSGLVWPEARARWSKTGYLTREAKGKGQVIMFAAQPNFRGYFYAAERLLLNAMLLGPGFGTRRSIEW